MLYMSALTLSALSSLGFASFVYILASYLRKKLDELLERVTAKVRRRDTGLQIFG